MSYRYVRRLMLNQSWIHNNFYIKPIQFPTSDLSRTFYFAAYGPTGMYFGLIGELLHSPFETTQVLHSVYKLFEETISECSEDFRVLEMLCAKLDDTYHSTSLAFQMWTQTTKDPHVSVISMGIQMLRYVTKDFQDVKLPNSTLPYESGKAIKYVRNEVRLTQLQFMFLATRGFTQPSFINRPDSIFELSQQLTDLFFYKLNQASGTSTDACVLLVDFNKFDQTHEFVQFGIQNLDFEIDTMLEVVPIVHDHFAAKLVLSELLLNAFKVGNALNMSLPIKVIVGFNEDEIYIEVFDMTVRSDNLTLKSTTDHDYLLDEYGRGLFLVNTFSNDVYIDNNSITSRIKRKNPQTH